MSHPRKKTISNAINITVFLLCILIFVFGIHSADNARKKKAKPTEPIQSINVVQKIHQNDHEEQMQNVQLFEITAYCACEKCCGKSDGITASGAKATEGITIAADTSVLPFGTQVEIDGNIYTVQDRGGAIKGNRIDIFFNTHEKALSYGRQTKDVIILNKGE